MEPKITISMTEEEWEQILNAVNCFEDEGPTGEGWKSDKFLSASDKFIALYEAALGILP